MKITLKYNVSIATNKGIRSINEDANFLGFNKSGQCLAIICDGIGSQDDSQIASQITINTFSKSFNAKNKIHNVKNWFKKCLNKAYDEVSERSNKYLSRKRIGTTLLLCVITDKHVDVFNLGDTRLYHYLFNENQWKQTTTDHNLYNHLLDLYNKDKTIKINELLLKYKSQLLSLTRCIESNSDVHINYSYYSLSINSGDLLFLVSDGVYHYIKLDDVTNVIKNLSIQSFESISDKLIKLALNNGSNDNLTSIVIECLNKNV